MDLVLFAVSLALIFAGSSLFTNCVEWLGRHFNLSEGVVGSVLAAVGTALPETVIPLIAIFFVGGTSGDEVGIGAILGAPFMLSTLALYHGSFCLCIQTAEREWDKDSRNVPHTATGFELFSPHLSECSWGLSAPERGREAHRCAALRDSLHGLRLARA